MGRVDAALDGVDGFEGEDPLADAWDYLTPMQRAISIHLMGGRSIGQIAEHFELSGQRVGHIIHSMRTRMIRKTIIG